LSTFSNTPLLTQAENRLWQLWFGGKRSGKSCHRAVRNIHSTPFMTLPHIASGPATQANAELGKQRLNQQPLFIC